MADKALSELKSIVKKHQEYIKDVEEHYDKNGMLTGANIKFKIGVALYYIDFGSQKRDGSFDVQIINNLHIVRMSLVNGAVKQTIDGFYSYNQKGKLGLLSGLGYVVGSFDLEIITPFKLGNLNIEGIYLSSIIDGWKSDSRTLYSKEYKEPHRTTDTSAKQSGAGITGAKSKKIMSVSQFDKFAKSKGFNAKFSDTKEFVAFMFKHSKDLFGRSSLKGMSWNAIYNLNPNSADWIGWSKIDTDDFFKYVKQYSRKK